jgi:flagellar hook-length control protein FliK
MALVDSLQAAQEAKVSPQFASLQKNNSSDEFSTILNSLRTEHPAAMASPREPMRFQGAERKKIQSAPLSATPGNSKASQGLRTSSQEQGRQQDQKVQDSSLITENANNKNSTDENSPVTVDHADGDGKDTIGQDCAEQNQIKTSLNEIKTEKESTMGETSGKILPDQKEPASPTDGESAKAISGELAVKSDLWAQIQSMILTMNPQSQMQLASPTQNGVSVPTPIPTAAFADEENSPRLSDGSNLETMLETLGSNLDKLALLLQNQKDYLSQEQISLKIPRGLSQQVVTEIRKTLSQLLASPENIVSLRDELAKMDLPPLNELLGNFSRQVELIKKEGLKNTSVDISNLAANPQNNSKSSEVARMPFNYPATFDETTPISGPEVGMVKTAADSIGTKVAHTPGFVTREMNTQSRNDAAATEVQTALPSTAGSRLEQGIPEKTPVEPSVQAQLKTIVEAEDQAGSDVNNKESTQHFNMQSTDKNKLDRLSERYPETVAKNIEAAASSKNVQPAVLIDNDRSAKTPSTSGKSVGATEATDVHSINPDTVIAKATQLGTATPVLRASEQNALWARVDKADVFSQIVDKARFLSGKQNSEILISLKPEFLGKMSVRTALMGNEIVASISTESTQVRNLLESQLPALRNSLSEQGVQVSRIEIVHDAGLSLTDLNQGNSPSHQNLKTGQNSFIPLRDSGMESEDASLEIELPLSIPLSSSGVINLVA